MARKSRRLKKQAPVASKINLIQQEHCCYEGDRLVRLLNLLKREIESVRLTEAALPEKFWFKQQFAIGVNDVTRVLERMIPITDGSSAENPSPNLSDCKASSAHLQVILVASDCNPRWLTKHLTSLAASRRVPVISVKDTKAGSVRLGELVKLKTAIAIGVKAKRTAINQLMTEVLDGKILDHERDSADA